jgi:hypothetical protein
MAGSEGVKVGADVPSRRVDRAPTAMNTIKFGMTRQALRLRLGLDNVRLRLAYEAHGVWRDHARAVWML